MIRDYMMMAARNLKKRKLRSFLTLVGIMIAIATIFVLISVSIGLENAVKEQFRILGTDKFFIQPKGQLAGPGTGGAVSLSEDDVKVVEKVTGVKKTSAWVASSAKVEFSKQTRYTSAVGIDLETSDLFIETGAYTAEEGRVLKKGDEGNVMIGSQYKNNNFFRKPIKEGDRIKINEGEFRVKGILKTIGNPGDDRLIYMPVNDFRELFNISERIDAIVVQVDDENNLNEIAERTKRRLMSARDVTEKTLDFYILTPEELLASFGTVLNVITIFLIGVAAISLVVGGIGITNTMYTSVLERTREIGVMKAIGAKNSDVLTLFLIESGMLGLVGGIVGISLGYGISKSIELIAINYLGTTLLRAAAPWYLIIGCLVFAFVSGAVAGAVPSWKASRLNPVEALRYE